MRRLLVLSDRIGKEDRRDSSLALGVVFISVENVLQNSDITTTCISVSTDFLFYGGNCQLILK